MHVIRHDYIMVKLELGQRAFLKMHCIHDHSRNPRITEVQRTRLRIIQKTIHREKRRP